MANQHGITINSFEQFDTQAKAHHDIRDHLYEMAGQFESQHQENIASKLDSQQSSTYNSWWNNVRNALVKQAQLHDYLGNQLLNAKNAYLTTDKSVDQSFDSPDNPS